MLGRKTVYEGKIMTTGVQNIEQKTTGKGRETKNEDNFAIVLAAMGVSTKHQAHFCHVFRGIIFL